MLRFARRRALEQMFLGRVTRRPCVQANSVNVPGVGLGGQQAVNQGVGVHAQFVSKLRRRHVEKDFSYAVRRLRRPPIASRNNGVMALDRPFRTVFPFTRSSTVRFLFALYGRPVHHVREAIERPTPMQFTCRYLTNRKKDPEYAVLLCPIPLSVSKRNGVRKWSEKLCNYNNIYKMAVRVGFEP